MIATVITNMILYGKSNLNSVDIHANQINNYRLAMLVRVKQCFQNKGRNLMKYFWMMRIGTNK